MPLVGALLAALSFRRQHMTMSIAAMLLGSCEASLAILMQAAPPRLH
jgi:dolichol kinase